MIRRHGTALRLALAAVDAIAANVLVLAISQFRLGESWPRVWAELLGDPLAPFLLVGAGWLVALWSQGLYRLRTRWSFASQAWATVRAAAGFGLATFALLFLFNVPDVSPAFLLLLLPSLAISALVVRAAIRALLAARWLRGGNTRNVLIIGSGSTALRFAQELEGHPTLGLTIVGYLNGAPHAEDASWNYLGSLDSLEDVLHTTVIDEVAVCLDLADWETIQNITELCRAEGKIVRLPLAGGILAAGTAYVEDLSGMPVLSIVQGPDRQLALAAKRLVDAIVAGMLLVISLPIFAAIAVAIRLDDRGPALFWQERVGLHGRRFQLAKFRTMIPGAEELLAEVTHLNEVKGSAFKMSNDPRVTRVGAFLRRTSLDELPQLWNVLRGEMSLIGPRPAPPWEVETYDIWHRRRLSMKPGISGLWQIGSRREDFDTRAELDLQYIDQWSLWLDLKIALLTLPAVLRMDNR